MTILHLTANELLVFNALPDAVRRSCVAEVFTPRFTDSEEHRWLRAVTSPLRNAGQADAGTAAAEKERMALAERFNPDSLSADDLRELFFLLGPEGMSLIILAALHAAKTADDLTQVEALALLRRSV